MYLSMLLILRIVSKSDFQWPCSTKTYVSRVVLDSEDWKKPNNGAGYAPAKYRHSTLYELHTYFGALPE